jgi:hypothetical protein
MAWSTPETGYGINKIEAGALYAMHYACTLPLLETPVACRIKVVGFYGGPRDVDIVRNSTTLTYTPNLLNATMKYSKEFVKNIGYIGADNTPLRLSTGCYNISFTAESLVGLPVNLLIDDALVYALQGNDGRS